MEKTNSLSVILITKNAERHLDACLSSVAWADQIVMVDSGSSDCTLEIAKQYGAEITQTEDWPGFGKQKNRALGLARCDWVLSIDADEVVTPELAAAIKAAITSADQDAWEISRLSSFCGQWIHHSGWQPDWIVRLFRRESARFTDSLVHESLHVPSGEIGRIDGKLLHYSYSDFEEVLAKANHYSTLAATMRLERGEKGGLAKALAKGFWAFFRTYILRAGFLDGRMGFVLAIYNAETTYYRYLKIMLRTQR
jgi:glycosyltransferase involved in cell wall biosynthesis